MYKPNDFGRRSINCNCRLDGTQELSETDVVDVIFYDKDIPGLDPQPWADIILNGVKVADCNAEFFKAQFKRVK